MKQNINWGIIGLGNIALQFAQAFRDSKNGKQKRSDGSLSDWINQKSYQSNKGCSALPTYKIGSNVVSGDQQAYLNKLEDHVPENIVIAAEEKSSATIFDLPKINQICSQAA